MWRSEHRQPHPGWELNSSGNKRISDMITTNQNASMERRRSKEWEKILVVKQNLDGKRGENLIMSTIVMYSEEIPLKTTTNTQSMNTCEHSQGLQSLGECSSKPCEIPPPQSHDSCPQQESVGPPFNPVVPFWDTLEYTWVCRRATLTVEIFTTAKVQKHPRWHWTGQSNYGIYVKSTCT